MSRTSYLSFESRDQEKWDQGRQVYVDSGHEKKENTFKETQMYEIQFHSLEIYGWKTDYKISKEQGGQQENRQTKGNLCRSVGNISGTFHIQAKVVPTFRPQCFTFKWTHKSNPASLHLTPQEVPEVIYKINYESRSLSRSSYSL